MALIDLNIGNIQMAFGNGQIDADYAARLRDLLRELTDNRGWGGDTINDGQRVPCANCPCGIYFNSPRPGDYRDWVWIEVNTNQGCIVWIHIVALDNGGWSWSVWSDRTFRGDDGIRPYYDMPPDFTHGPVYKTENRPGNLTTVFDEICSKMQDLCDCKWF